MRSMFVVLVMAALAADAPAQQQQNAQSTAPAATQTAARTHRVKKRSPPALQRIPIESAPPSQVTPATPAQDAQQRAQDAKVEAQAQARSAADAKVNDAIVQKAQERQDKVQSEIRIQDAPGPAQTGVVPAAGPPVVPATSTAPVTTPPPPGQRL